MEPGITDDEVLAIANRVQAILITADRDFGEIVFRRRLHTHGIILLRLAGLSPERKADLVASAIVQHETELRQAFAVITPAILRIRITDQ
ncbi:DUF5615 family PIN-like protein [Chloroflexus islandicus]|uniref:DUF5615 family PIN-like protein n=1 Tax=Chloroflexus islandicus TaxID=1707952 RepID=UPI001C12C991|nr:DUF5615 family PIN-like protein [Chloroflexus islandicus]